MKTFIISFTGYFIFSCISIAQRPITAEDSKITFKHGTIPGFMLTIPEVTYKAVEESWIKSLEKGTKSKVQNDSLPANIKEQEQTRKAIDQQKEVVRSFGEKCNTIRG